MAYIKGYSQAISEVLEILQYADEEIIRKIPLAVLQKMNEQKAVTYVPKFKETEGVKEEEISPKAKAILAVLYKDYICTKEVKQKTRSN